MTTTDTTYFGTLTVSGGHLPVDRMDVIEAYNGGWVGQVPLRASTRTGRALSLTAAMGTAAAMGMYVGAQAFLRLGAHDGSEESAWLRNFPGFVAAVAPYRTVNPLTNQRESWIRVYLEDPVTHLAGQRIWGAFRGHSAAEMVGGALSLAAGTEGRATLNPAVPDQVGKIEIRSELRDSLDFIPYAIASGQTLGEWLADFFGLLAIRMEMLATEEGDIAIMLKDGAPRDEPFEMQAGNGRRRGNGEGEDVATRIATLSIGAHTGVRGRATLLDDPTKGGFKRLGSGPVGDIVAGIHIDVDEAALRADAAIRGRAAEMLVATVHSRLPSFRPGRTVALDSRLIESIGWTADWQISWVKHALRGLNYHNEADLLNAEFVWVPERPPRRAAVIVPAYIDAGPTYVANSRVPRDRLGRIPVGFPFSPSLDYEDMAMTGFDTDMDQRITKEDFGDIIRQESDSDAEWARMDAEGMQAALRKAAGGESWLDEERKAQAALLADTTAREEDVNRLNSGEYDDPYHPRRNEDLTSEELARREELAALRTRTFRYLAWRRALAFEEAGGDYDHDGVVTVVDDRMSDELRAIFDDPVRLEALKEDAGSWSSRTGGGGDGGEDSGGGDGDGEPVDEPPEIVQEYLRLFGEESDDVTARVGRLQRAAADEQWPPRLPLSIMQPMAGGQHGFVSGHRQGDACRVAVHNVLNAEIVGFQYRSDRDLKESFSGATTGIVVEHDQVSSWSGMVFRTTE